MRNSLLLLVRRVPGPHLHEAHAPAAVSAPRTLGATSTSPTLLSTFPASDWPLLLPICFAQPPSINGDTGSLNALKVRLLNKLNRARLLLSHP